MRLTGSMTVAEATSQFQTLQTTNDNPAFTKACRFVPTGSRLNGACLYSAAIPTDALSIVYHDEPARRGDSLGVALVTPVLDKVKAPTLLSKLFGGEFYEADISPQYLHYITETNGGNMKLGEKVVPRIRTLIPSYAGGVAGTGMVAGGSSDACYREANCGSIASPARCVAATLQPGFMLVTQSYVSGNVLTSWLASFGGILSVTMVVLGAVHVCLRYTCGSSSLCVPSPDEGRAYGYSVDPSARSQGKNEVSLESHPV